MLLLVVAAAAETTLVVVVDGDYGDAFEWHYRLSL